MSLNDCIAFFENNVNFLPERNTTVIALTREEQKQILEWLMEYKQLKEREEKNDDSSNNS